MLNWVTPQASEKDEPKEETCATRLRKIRLVDLAGNERWVTDGQISRQHARELATINRRVSFWAPRANMGKPDVWVPSLAGSSWVHFWVHPLLVSSIAIRFSSSQIPVARPAFHISGVLK